MKGKVIAITLILYFGLVTQPLMAEMDTTTHWPYKVSLIYNAIYGSVSGLDVEDGDSVGVFDSAGNCYGAGLIRGGRYWLSAHMLEAAERTNPNDMTIPGFKEGDQVIFRVYTSGKEYTLEPSSGEPYFYKYTGEDIPIAINIAYTKKGVSDVDDSDSTDSPDSGGQADTTDQDVSEDEAEGETVSTDDVGTAPVFLASVGGSKSDEKEKDLIVDSDDKSRPLTEKDEGNKQTHTLERDEGVIESDYGEQRDLSGAKTSPDLPVKYRLLDKSTKPGEKKGSFLIAKEKKIQEEGIVQDRQTGGKVKELSAKLPIAVKILLLIAIIGLIVFGAKKLLLS